MLQGPKLLFGMDSTFSHRKQGYKNTSQSILVTGGSGKIGRAVCHRFAKEKWRVGVHYHTQQTEARKTAELVDKAGGEAQVVQADLQQYQEITTMIETLGKNWGKLDVLVCNAGHAKTNLLLRTSPKEWEDMLRVNLRGVFYCLKSVAPIFLSQNNGVVIIVGSLSSLQGTMGQAAYSTAKAGLLGLMKSTAKEWGPFNVRINIVFPGWHQSNLAGEGFPEPHDLTNHVLQRTPHLDSIADAIFHVSQMREASGQVFNLDSRIW